MNSAFLALTAAGLAGLGGYGISAQTSAIQTAQVVTSTPDYGREAGVFSQWLNRPGASVRRYLEDWFGGAHDEAHHMSSSSSSRALYVAIPPISRELPPGDSAVIASANGRSMIALVSRSGGVCALPCARFRFVDARLKSGKARPRQSVIPSELDCDDGTRACRTTTVEETDLTQKRSRIRKVTKPPKTGRAQIKKRNRNDKDPEVRRAAAVPFVPLNQMVTPRSF